MLKTARNVLFEPTKIENMELRNRFVRSATYDGCANDGYVTDQQVNLYTTLSKGGVGLIITGITHVHKNGRISKFQNSIAGDEFIDGLKRLSAAVHQWGARIAVQLFHGGREARLPNSLGGVPMAPSFLEKDPYFNGKYRVLTEDEIWEIIRAFGDGAKRAREAGFDAVQIHGAHGYLLSQFLSPYTNRRDDKWGGELRNRLRFHREVYQDIRRKVDKDYPVLIKIWVQDGFPGGLDFSEGKLAAIHLAEFGFDALEVSQGLRGPGYENTEFRIKINSVNREAYFCNWCRQIKNQVQVPVMVVGGLRTFKLMEEIVQNGEADFISLSRPLIRNPAIINDWKKGNHHTAECTSCNKCFEGLRKGEILRCVQREKDKKNKLGCC